MASAIKTETDSTAAAALGSAVMGSEIKFDIKDTLNGCAYFNYLAEELVDMILDYVRTCHKSTLNARLVCRSWNKIIRPKLNFQGSLTDHNIESLVALSPEIPLKLFVLSKLAVHTVGSPSDSCYKSRIVNARKHRKIYNASYFPRSVEHLVIGGDIGEFLKKHGPDEQPFSLSSGFAEKHRILPFVNESIDGFDLVNILVQLKDIRILTLSSIAFLSVSMCMIRRFDYSKFSNLTKFDVCIGKKTCIDKMICFFEKTSCPNLTSFYVRMYAMLCDFRIYVTIMKFIGRHQRLKNLSFSQANAQYIIINKDQFDLRRWLPSSFNTLENLLKIELDCLRMDLMVMHHPIAAPWKTLERGFIKAQRQLRSIDLQVSLPEIRYRLDHLLPDCNTTLEHLELSVNCARSNLFNCASLSEFKKLTRCHLYMVNGAGVQLTNLHLLPTSITSLHLANLLPTNYIGALIRRLTNLQRISYGGSLDELRIPTGNFIRYLVEHLKSPLLAEFRLYRYHCFAVINELDSHAGLYASCEDDDTTVVIIDHGQFDLENFLKYVRFPRCECRGGLHNRTY